MNYIMANNTLAVPQAKAALDQLKYEVAQELGIQLQAYNGNLATRDAGSIGGNSANRRTTTFRLHRKLQTLI